MYYLPRHLHFTVDQNAVVILKVTSASRINLEVFDRQPWNKFPSYTNPLSLEFPTNKWIIIMSLPTRIGKQFMSESPYQLHINLGTVSSTWVQNILLINSSFVVLINFHTWHFSYFIYINLSNIAYDRWIIKW